MQIFNSTCAYAYDKQPRDWLSCSIRKYNLVGGRDEEVLPHHHIYIYIFYIYISIITIIESLFCCYQLNSLLPLIPSFSFITVLIDFLTIIRYRKNDINNILWFIIITQYAHYLETANRKPNFKFVLWDIWIYDHILFWQTSSSQLAIESRQKLFPFLLIDLIKLFMTSIDEQQQQPPSPTVERYNKK